MSRKSQSKRLQMHDERKNFLTAASDYYTMESYKTLRTNVTFSLPDETGCKAVMITSAVQGEGKSLTAVNLAISYAQADRRVLLIDCDLRMPMLSILLNTESTSGLSNLLVQPELLEEAILHSDDYGMDMLLSGDIPPNPSELLGSMRMKQLLEQLRLRYDYIIMDTPPVTMVTDAVVLAPMSEGVLFVVRSDYSERGSVTYALEQLEYVKAKVLGFVLNGVDMGKDKYSKRYYKKYRKYGY